MKQRLEEILQSILIDYEESNESTYHYTSINSFKSIIENNELWLTNARYMNDKLEFIDYLDVCVKASEELSKIQNENGFIKLYNELRTKQLKNFGQSSEALSSYFIFSTCAKNDYVPMWSYYADNVGLSICFDTNELNQFISNYIKQVTNSGIEIWTKNYNCIYNFESKKDIVYKYVSQVTDEFGLTKRDAWIKTPPINNTLLKYAWIFKNNSFEYEKEYRYLFCLSDALSKIDNEFIKLDFVSNNYSIKPIVKLKFDSIGSLPIKKVYISPLNTNGNIKMGLNRFLSFNGRSDIEVVQCDNGLVKA